jgi:hypothetical protein
MIKSGLERAFIIFAIDRHQFEPVARLGGRREVASVDIGAEMKPVIASRVKEAQR